VGYLERDTDAMKNEVASRRDGHSTDVEFFVSVKTMHTADMVCCFNL